MSATLAAVKRFAAETPRADAVIAPGARLSYDVLAQGVDECAALLRSAGVGAGDRVVLALPGSERFVILLLALQEIGALAVPLEPRSRILASVAGEVEASLVVCADRPEAEALAALSSCWLPLVLDAEASGALSGLTILRPAAPASLVPSHLAAAILYTSGSSGRQKGVIVTRAYIDRVAQIGRSILGITASDRIATLAPLTHFYSMREIDTALGAGAALVIAPYGPFLTPLLSLLRQEAATGLVAVPAMLLQLLANRNLPLFLEVASRLRYLAVGTADMPADLRASLKRQLARTEVLLTYGLTECSRVACGFLRETPDGSVGRALPGVEISIRTEDGLPCPLGRPGRVHIRSPNMMEGYWTADGPIPAELTLDDFLATDDIGALDENGFLFVKGRCDDVMNVGGHKVSLREIEATLSAHPDVAEALTLPGRLAEPPTEAALAAVIPVPGTRVTPADLMRHCAGALPPHKCPRKILLVDSFFRTSMGKLDRPRIARLFDG